MKVNVMYSQILSGTTLVLTLKAFVLCKTYLLKKKKKFLEYPPIFCITVNLFYLGLVGLKITAYTVILPLCMTTRHNVGNDELVLGVL